MQRKVVDHPKWLADGGWIFANVVPSGYVNIAIENGNL